MKRSLWIGHQWPCEDSFKKVVALDSVVPFRMLVAEGRMEINQQEEKEQSHQKQITSILSTMQVKIYVKSICESALKTIKYKSKALCYKLKYFPVLNSMKLFLSFLWSLQLEPKTLYSLLSSVNFPFFLEAGYDHHVPSF